MQFRSYVPHSDIDQAIEYVSKAEKIEKVHSLRKLARIGFEYYIVKAYRDGKITLREASDLLKLTLSETIDLLADMGVKGNIRAEDVLVSLNTFSSLNS